MIIYGRPIRALVVQSGGGGEVTPSFPDEPMYYNVIETVSTAGDWTVPEDGWFKIELFGASGSGGNAVSGTYSDSEGDTVYESTSGFGGGGGAYSLSEGVAMNAGDIIRCSTETNGTTTLNVYSSVAEVGAITMSCTKGEDGRSPTWSSGSGYNYSSYDLAAGGVASGGLTSNLPGGSGGKAVGSQNYNTKTGPVAGGSAAHEDGNTGGASGYAYAGSSGGNLQGETGKPAFFRVSRGNTNVVAG